MENAEDYVSFEVAMLLKEKGFDERGLCVYVVEDKSLIVFGDWVENSCLLEHLIAAPTHQMALKWLREVHKIFVEPFVAIDLNGKYHYCFRLLNSICKDILEPKDLVKIDFKDTYEEAVETALLYVLKNLI